MRHRRPHAHLEHRRRLPGGRRLGLVGVILGLLLLGCGCASAVTFGLVRSAQHHR